MGQCYMETKKNLSTKWKIILKYMRCALVTTEELLVKTRTRQYHHKFLNFARKHSYFRCHSTGENAVHSILECFSFS